MKYLIIILAILSTNNAHAFFETSSEKAARANEYKRQVLEMEKRIEKRIEEVAAEAERKRKAEIHYQSTVKHSTYGTGGVTSSSNRVPSRRVSNRVSGRVR